MKQLKYKLKLLDRVSIVAILPQQGDFVTLASSKLLNDKLSLKEKDFNDYKIKSSEQGLMWDAKKADKEVVYDFTPEQVVMIGNQLKELENKKMLKMDYMNIYKMFVDES